MFATSDFVLLAIAYLRAFLLRKYSRPAAVRPPAGSVRDAVDFVRGMLESNSRAKPMFRSSDEKISR